MTQVAARSDRPIVAALIVAVGAIGFVIARLAVVGHGQISRFVMAERPFADPSRVPAGLPVLPGNGYDGQFFYRLALNPTDLHRSGYGITFDNSYRLERIGYPVLAWLVSFGHHPWVPAALVAVNVLALACVGFLGGILAHDARRHAVWGLLVAGYFGFVFSLARDTAEPVAAAFLLAGVLAYRRRHPVVAGLLLAYGALTRETVMVAVLAIAIVRAADILRGRARPGWDDSAWLIPVAAFAAWQAVVHLVTGNFALGSDVHDNTGTPVYDVLHAIALHFRAISIHSAANDAWVVEFVSLAVFIALAALTLRSTTAPPSERTAFVLFFLEFFVLSANIWNGVADLRALDEVYLFAVLILLGSRRRLLVPALVLTPALLVVVAHRVVSL